MGENEVIYTDVKFVKRKEEANEPVSSSVDTTDSEVKTVKTTTEPTGSSSRRSKVNAESAVLLLIIVLLMAAVAGLVVTYFMNMKTTESLKIKLESEIKNLTERLSKMNTMTPTCPEPTTVQPPEACKRCEDGWKNHGEMCYYFSTHKLRWNESRAWCQGHGGDLVQIDSRAEQGFLGETLKMKMTETEDKFWIGLTDSETEGKWLWVDGSSLKSSLSFWSGVEPDNWLVKDSDGEDCARMGEMNGGLYSWFDRTCKEPHKFICEESAKDGVYRMKCVSTDPEIRAVASSR